MKRKPVITIRMGAAHWDITIAGQTRINMRELDTEQQRKVIFTVVKACREAGRVVT